jgi:hypothetical protein
MKSWKTMPKIAYIDKRFGDAALSVIYQANEIIHEYQQQGFSLTLRQLYYQFVSRDIIPNKQSEYKKLGLIINNARLAGYIDWDAIEDRTRNLRRVPTWDSPNDILRTAANSFKIDLWENQENYVEVWIEKDALVGVIEPICNKLRVPFFACRGYSSQSEQWEAGQRLIRRIDNGKIAHILHLGDHDPSGIDMTRDNEERLRMFIAHHSDPDAFNVHRLALNMDQVRKHKPPPNPAKSTDTRFASYENLYGNESWELDALEPKLISELIRHNVNDLIDSHTWDEDVEREEEYISKLTDLADNEEF